MSKLIEKKINRPFKEGYEILSCIEDVEQLDCGGCYYLRHKCKHLACAPDTRGDKKFVIFVKQS